MKRAMLLIVALATFGCSEAPTGAAFDVEPQFSRGGGGIIHSVRGSGHTTHFFGDVDGDKRVFSFTAREHADGMMGGQFQITIMGVEFGSENPAITRYAQAEVICLSVVGNRAWVGGTITSSSNPTFLGDELAWVVEDNGQGPASGDLISVTQFPPEPPGFAQAQCDAQSQVPGRLVEGGNVQVR